TSEGGFSRPAGTYDTDESAACAPLIPQPVKQFACLLIPSAKDALMLNTESGQTAVGRTVPEHAGPVEAEAPARRMKQMHLEPLCKTHRIAIRMVSPQVSATLVLEPASDEVVNESSLL